MYNYRMILIIGAKDELHSNYIYEKLKKAGEDVSFFDTRQIPNNLTISWNASDSEFKNGYFKFAGKKFHFSDIKSVYWRNHYGYYQPLAKKDPQLYWLLSREIESAFNSVFMASDWLWCNSLSAIELHKKKTYQLNLMSQSGIRVPRTLITNNREDIENFLEENNDKVIFKPVLGGASTQAISKNDLTEEHLETLENSPVQFQEMIEGVDVRVFVIGNEIFPAEIRATTLDFRDDKDAKIVPVELPEKVKQDCLKIMPLLDLNYSGIDIRRTSQGEYVFIEANPAPMFIHFEQQSGYPISDTLIKLLKR